MKTNRIMENRKGFTLIEMLVVIAIIGLLSSIIVIGLGSARSQARDARRMADVKEIQNYVEQNFVPGTGYPPALPASMPKDPLNNNPYGYEVCGTSNNEYYIAATLEKAPPVGQTGSTNPCGGTPACQSGVIYCVSNQ